MMTTPQPNAAPAPQQARVQSNARYVVALAAFAIAMLFLLWTASNAILLIFAGIVFAAFLDGLSQLLARILPLGHGARLAIVCTILALLVGGGLAWGGVAVATQADEFVRTLREQFTQVSGWLEQRGLNLPDIAAEQQTAPQSSQAPPSGGDPGAETPTFRSYLPSFQGVFGTAWTAASIVFGIVGNIVIIVFLGIFFAAQPKLYRDAVLLLLPPHYRPHVRTVLNETGETLRHWLLGQAVTMSAIFLFVWGGLSLLGIQPAFVLGLQAGLLAFIPNVGPLIAGIFILLASLGGGLTAVLGALGVYLAAQTLESYILTPMIQDRAISVPPAFLFAAQIMLGLLFGLYGLALATPIAAIARVFILRFYVEDTLGDEHPKLGLEGGA
jgi:predicted PurR-regulated permease PerM